MLNCVFFGHRDCPEEIMGLLRKTVLDLLKEDRCCFMVGNNGRFDRMVRRCMEELAKKRNDFDYMIVLEQLPKEGEPRIERSILADGVEDCPPRYRIDRRNEYMLKKADVVVCYVTKGYGGAAKFAGKARRKKKRVVNIANEKDRQ